MIVAVFLGFGPGIWIDGTDASDEDCGLAAIATQRERDGWHGTGARVSPAPIASEQAGIPGDARAPGRDPQGDCGTQNDRRHLRRQTLRSCRGPRLPHQRRAGLDRRAPPPAVPARGATATGPMRGERRRPGGAAADVVATHMTAARADKAKWRFMSWQQVLSGDHASTVKLTF